MSLATVVNKLDTAKLIDWLCRATDDRVVHALACPDAFAEFCFTDGGDHRLEVRPLLERADHLRLLAQLGRLLDEAPLEDLVCQLELLERTAAAVAAHVEEGAEAGEQRRPGERQRHRGHG